MAKNGRVQAITRLIVTTVLFVNAMLTMAGKNPIPLDESTVGEVVSLIASGVMVLWSWYKNNNLTKNALTMQAWKEQLDREKK